MWVFSFFSSDSSDGGPGDKKLHSNAAPVLVFSDSAAARRPSALYGKLSESDRGPRKGCALVFTGFDYRLYDTFLKDYNSNM